MDTASWLFNYVPWWVWTIIAVVLLVVFWQTLLPIWLALPKWLKGLSSPPARCSPPTRWP